MQQFQSTNHQLGDQRPTHNGAEVFEFLCGDDIWQIERCPLKSSSCCLVLQKDIKHYYKAIIISKQIDRGILVMCYVG
jgi:hypothetical protein